MEDYSFQVVDRVFLYIVGISVILLLLITVLMVYFIIRYRKDKNPEAVQIEGNTALEIVWTVVPTAIVISMFLYGWKGFDFLRRVPENHIEIKVTARMWSWLFEYPSGKKSDKLYAPQNKPVKLVLSSEDVIHSLYIPALRVKEDAVPGLTTYLWFKAENQGEYDIYCAEYCGTGHSSMLTKLLVIPQEEFEQWLKAGAEEKSVSVRGFELLKEKGCTGCHTTDGSNLVGPTFKGIFMRRTRVNREGREVEIVADEEYIKNSIVEPSRDVVKDYPQLMPSYRDSIKEDELKYIIEYLKTLK